MRTTTTITRGDRRRRKEVQRLGGDVLTRRAPAVPAVGSGHSARAAARLPERQLRRSQPPVAAPLRRVAGSAAGILHEFDEDVLEFAVAGQQLVDRTLAQETAAVDDGDAVADAFDLGEQVGVEQHRAAAGAELDDHVAHLAAADGVEVGGRFVEDEQLGLVQEGLGEREPLPHALGERAAPGDRRPAEARRVRSSRSTAASSRPPRSPLRAPQ